MSVGKRWNKSKTKYTWEFSITLCKYPRKQYRKSGYKTKSEAQEAEAQALSEKKNGINLAKENSTFEELAKTFLKVSSKLRAKSTIRNYTISFKNHMQFFYKFKLRELSSLTVEDWSLTIDKTPSTIAECIKFGKAVYSYAIKHRLCTFNPFKNIQKPTVITKKHNRLTPDEAFKLLNLCKLKFPDFFPILTLALFTGMREGELLALKWSDVDFKNGKIAIKRQYTQGELKETLKTASSNRIVDITPSIIKMLQNHKKFSKIISQYIFVNNVGNLHNSRNLISRRFEPLLEMLFEDKKYMRFHDLRGTYVDILLSEGIPLKYIQIQLGHANYLTTMNNYSELIPDVNIHAVNVLDKKIKMAV